MLQGPGCRATLTYPSVPMIWLLATSMTSRCGVRLFPGIAYGTSGYPEKIARRLRAVNIAAWSVASATLFFAILRFFDPRPEML
jgi:hypothetical protein